MRLIDADALLKEIKTYLVRPKFYSPYNSIELAPTIDAQPVVHGKWIEDEDGDGRHCSICDTDYCYLVSHCEEYKFCPNCGAKMDEVI